MVSTFHWVSLAQISPALQYRCTTMKGMSWQPWLLVGLFARWNASISRNYEPSFLVLKLTSERAFNLETAVDALEIP